MRGIKECPNGNEGFVKNQTLLVVDAISDSFEIFLEMLKKKIPETENKIWNSQT